MIRWRVLLCASRQRYSTKFCCADIEGLSQVICQSSHALGRAKSPNGGPDHCHGFGRASRQRVVGIAIDERLLSDLYRLPRRQQSSLALLRLRPEPRSLGLRCRRPRILHRAPPLRFQLLSHQSLAGARGCQYSLAELQFQ